MTGEQQHRNKRKNRQGKVLKAMMQKTIIVWVQRRMRHPKYEKVVITGKKYYVHDEKNEAKTGDTVEIMETKPFSKLKKWRLVKILRKAAESLTLDLESGKEKN